MAPPKKRKPQPVGVASVQRSNKPLIIGISVAVGVLILIAIVAAVVGERGDEDTNAGRAVEQWQPVSVTGTALPQFSSEAGGSDPAAGTPAPQLAGASFNDDPVNITNDGKAKAIMFLAHWCPHCQDEAPKLAEWISENRSDYPNVDFYAVATGTTAGRANFPPSDWFDELNFPAAVMADSQDSAAATAYGLSSYPYAVFVGADGNIAQRVSGELGGDVFGQYVANVAGQSNVTPTTSAAQTAETSPAAG